MVRHATAKKRRSGVKVSRKGPKHSKLKVKNAVKDTRIKEIWDGSLTPAENLVNLGLEKNVNKLQYGRECEKTSGFMGFARLNANEPLNHAPDENSRRKKMSLVDQNYAARCISRYGANYHKMELDVAVNDRQLTEAKVKKMCEKFLSLEDGDRDVPIPSAK